MRAWTIAEQDLHINARLTVIGGTSSEVEGEDPILLARRLGLRNVAFIPPTSQAELAVLLRRADVFVLPSVNESFGQVFFEALRSGIPVVACQSGAPGELLASQCPPVGGSVNLTMHRLLLVGCFDCYRPVRAAEAGRGRSRIRPSTYTVGTRWSSASCSFTRNCCNRIRSLIRGAKPEVVGVASERGGSGAVLVAGQGHSRLEIGERL